MASHKQLTARQAAWKALNTSDIAKHNTSDVLNRLLDQTDRSGQTTDIVMGVTRLRGTLDRILRKCASLDTARVKPSQWNLLRMGAYELVFCPKTAEYAILNETAGLADSKKGAGFINAVLRNVQRAIELREGPLEADRLTRMIPQGPETGCLFKIDLLPNFETQPEQYLTLAYSMPQVLVHSWATAYGVDQAKNICIASNRHPGVILQPNTLKVGEITDFKVTQNDAKRLPDDAKTYAEDTTTHTDDATKRTHDVTFYQGGAVSVRAAGKIDRSKAYLEGLFYVQDMTAAMVTEILSPEAGWVVADLCSAPGGKSVAMAMRMRDQGVILASDIDADRLKRVGETARRLGLRSIEVVPADGVEEAIGRQGRLDAIVLDVPCSNTGVLARRVEARWRWSVEQTAEIVRTQRKLLEKAAGLARAGTKIVYSTCSIQPEENERQVEWFLQTHREFRLVTQKLTFPATETPDAFDHDGGFAAVVVRK
jgi:16S rRNA (cytosine967-C5)-methyltransferase